MPNRTSLTPEAQRIICDSLRAGNYRTTACSAAGIHRNTIRNWITRGEKGEEPYASFVAALDEVEGEAEALLLAEVRIGVKDWQARAWILERRWPGKWGGRVRLTVNEHVDQLTSKLRADPELHQRVVDVLDQEPPTNAAEPH